MMRRLLISLLGLFFVIDLFAVNIAEVDTTLNSIDIVGEEVHPSFVDKLEELHKRWYVESNMIDYADSLEVLRKRKRVVKCPDSVYINRLDEMQSAIQLSYNKIVRNYIELYTVRRRAQMSSMLGLAEYYFPIFEELLDAYELPLELKYLPVIESALNPRAFSRAGACGLWQFMYGTGRMYKLSINSYVDERRDPIRSSHAAVKFLKDMYKIYGDWILVIAAYNCGPGNVNKAIRRSGGKKNYWDIYYRLPKETRGYVPAFIAAMYAFNYHKEHNIIPVKSDFPIMCDTVMLINKVHFKQISHILNIPIAQLRDLNPQYRRDIVPASKVKPLALNLPYNYVGDFIDSRDTVLAYNRNKFFDNRDRIVNPRDRYQEYAHSAPRNRAKIHYKVKSGDAVSLIADWFNVRTADLKYWNNIRRNVIRVGQRLVIYVPRNHASYYKKFNRMSYAQKQATRGRKPKSEKVSKSSSVDYSGDYIYYTVRRGDNLWTIARKFPGVSNKDIMRLNNIRNAKNIKPGKRLKIRKI
jgi:membrane-bound lytic murein transglycosylase D